MNTQALRATRSLRLPLVAALAAFAAVASCSSESSAPDDGDTPASGPTYYRDVKPILDGRCVTCHDAGEIAPFSLTSFKEAEQVKDQLVAAVTARIMPPWSAARGHKDYQFDPSLTDDQIATIEAWVKAGAPEGKPEDVGDPLPPVQQTMSRVDATLSMPVTYTPTLTPDEYRCFIIDWPYDREVYVTGFNAAPGNPKIGHHIAAFLIRPDNPFGEEAFNALTRQDGMDGKPGYTCFGGPAGSSPVQIPAMQLGQWVPGQGGGDFPAGTGVQVPAGSMVVLQMHYNLETPGESDLTSLEFKVEDTVERPAAFAPWLNTDWVFGQMKIPPYEADVMYGHIDDPREFFKDFVGNTDVEPGFMIHAVMLHMHQLGKKAMVAIDRADGSRETLLQVDDWDFHWQRLYQLKTPVKFNPGDKMNVECHWDNTEQNQPIIGGVRKVPIEVNWGENTDEEMCVGNLYVSQLAPL